MEGCLPITNKIKNQRDRKHRTIPVATVIMLENHSSNISMINYNKQRNIFRSNWENSWFSICIPIKSW